MELKSPKEVIEGMKNAYIHEDKETIDIIVDNEDKTFIEELVVYKCLRCETSIIRGNEKLTKIFTDTVNGIQISCNNCKQKFFIHKPIMI